ncbi:MAG: MAPEG family protein [Burkholderiaceae bacterium]|nr:MAPEG family protein [Burkholderiaceae bacterium]
MNPLLSVVVQMAIVTWLTLLAASLVRVKGWTLAGTLLAFGNRDDLPQPSPLAGRAERTARNTLENFVLFAAIALVAQAAATPSPRVLLGAQVFFWSRIAYIPVYYAGIRYLRTAVWAASIVGLGMMVSALV